MKIIVFVLATTRMLGSFDEDRCGAVVVCVIFFYQMSLNCVKWSSYTEVFLNKKIYIFFNLTC